MRNMKDHYAILSSFIYLNPTLPTSPVIHPSSSSSKKKQNPTAAIHLGNNLAPPYTTCYHYETPPITLQHHLITTVRHHISKETTTAASSHCRTTIGRHGSFSSTHHFGKQKPLRNSLAYHFRFWVSFTVSVLCHVRFRFNSVLLYECIRDMYRYI